MKRIVPVLICLVALASLIGWRLNLNRQTAAAQARMEKARFLAPPLVSVAPARIRDILQTFQGVGTVQAPLNTHIGAKVTGRIVFLQAQPGDHVTRGEALVRIDPSQVRDQVNQQRATIAEDRWRLAQATLTQNPTNVSVITQISQQAAALASAQADDRQTRQNYARQVGTAQEAVTDAQGKLDAAVVGIANAQTAVRSAQASLANAQAHFNREDDLYKQGFIAAQDVDDAKTAVAVQQSAVDAANGQVTAANAARDSAAAQLKSAGDQLAIAQTSGQANIDAADARVTQAKAALEYARSNTAQKPAYAANLAALRSEVSAAVAQLANLQSQLADTVLVSPLDGWVTARYMDPGAVATPGQSILDLVAIQAVWVILPVPEEVSRKIAVGQPAVVTLDALPDRKFTGRITAVNPSADPQSRDFAVRITLPNAGSAIKPGMFARVSLVTERVRNALVAPREAVQSTAAGESVTVIDADSRAHVRQVATGPQDASGIAITRGLQPGERIVTLSANPIRDGQVVRVSGTAVRARRP